MQALARSDIFLFEDFRFDRRGGLLRRDDSGAFVPVVIGSRALDILGVLIERAGEVVTKDEIIDAVWPGTVVEDSNLTVQMSALRRVLDRGRLNASCIQTVAGRGYRFVTSITKISGSGAPDKELQRASTSSIPRLSIVVLPFVNLSNDPDQQYFGDAMADDLTTDLSRITGMFVIARNTAFTYRNRPFSAKQIGRELGVRYALEGSVQRSGNQVRVNAQLIDAESDAHLWAERFEGNTSDLFALQNEITARIAVELNLELIAVEAARPTPHPGALDYYLRGRAAMLKPPSRDRYAEAISLFERALTLDSQSVETQSWLVTMLTGRVIDNMTDTATADMARAESLAGQALATSPRSGLAHYARGQLLRAQRRYAEAIPEYETALASNRNWASAFGLLGWCKLLSGWVEETIRLEEQAIRLSPRDANIGVWYLQIGAVHLLQSRMDEAILWLERARNHSPAHSGIRAHLAAAYALNGDTERAAVELAEARSISPDDRFSSLARLRAAAYFGVPKVRALFEATYFVGLHTAGVPAE